MGNILNILGTTPYLRPFLILISGLLLGWFFQSIVAKQLKKIAKRTKWKGDDLLVEGMGQTPILWFILLGIYISSFDIPFIDGYSELARQMVVVIFIISIAIVISRVAVLSIHFYARKQTGALQSTSMFGILTKLTIYILAALVIMQTLGISILPLLTALGVGGLAVALALQDTLSNLFAGLHIIATHKFRPGDFIELETGQSGIVQDISWRNTTIQTLANNFIIVPNAKVASDIVINYSGPQKEMSVLVPVCVAYDSDLERVEEVVVDEGRKILSTVEGAVCDFEPFIRYTEFGENGITLKVILRVKEYVSQYLITHRFIKALHARFKKEGIHIPFPQRDVHIHNKQN
ncbi:mechanosensitive ion channel family protein [Patescibacteria group bacterium]|nr:mechanosensitive ion channel family protein [Patescibacteria group bacterium]MBU1703688.1 mechanosensitive ion channel family protein [Patescibacteria group bacterium]MBU1953685.1 mechanosensitive ion channel family protein [Patescibacteria group bacterium]